MEKDNKLSGIHEILRDPECKWNVMCMILAFITVIGGLCLLIYGCAYLMSADALSNNYYDSKFRAELVEKLVDKYNINNGKMEEMMELVFIDSAKIDDHLKDYPPKPKECKKWCGEGKR